MPSILLVRHGQASFGGADYDVLSEQGHAQVAATADELRRRGVSAARVHTGGLVRQQGTAGPIAEALGAEVVVDARWDEYRADDLLAHHADTDLRLERDATPVSPRAFQAVLERGLLAWAAAGDASPAQEPWPAFAARVRAALTDLAGGLGRGETGVVCTSGGVIGALTATLLGAPDTTFVALNRVTINGSLTRVAHGRSGTTLVSFNEASHLEPLGLVTYR